MRNKSVVSVLEDNEKEAKRKGHCESFFRESHLNLDGHGENEKLTQKREFNLK